MESFIYRTKGVCSSEISISVKDGIVEKVLFKYGCDGNSLGIAKLVEGMPVDQVIEKLKGIDCGGKGTSCPDQLARALQEHYLNAGQEIGFRDRSTAS